MSYVKTINEDGVVSDIMAKALEATLDATLLHKSELVNGFTQTMAGVNALDAVQANKNVNGTLAYNIDQQIATKLQFGIGSNGDKTSYPRAELRSAGSASSGTKAMTVRYYQDENNYTDAMLCDKDGDLLPDYATKTDVEATVATSGVSVASGLNYAISNIRMVKAGHFALIKFTITNGSATNISIDRANRTLAVITNNNFKPARDSESTYLANNATSGGLVKAKLKSNGEVDFQGNSSFTCTFINVVIIYDY